MRQRHAWFSVIVPVVLAALGAAPRDAHAQAWVADKGDLDASLDYNFATSDKVVTDSSTLEFLNGGTTTHQITVGGEYVPIRGLAVNVSLPLVFLKYTGSKTMYPHAGGGTYDDGNTHTTLTEFRGGARYQILDEPFALSAGAAVSIPVADYETIGNTVAGRHLKALHLNVAVGRLIGDASYVHLSYEFSLVAKYDRTVDTAKYGQDRSDVSFSIGHKVLDQRLDLHLDANMHVTHGGVEFSKFGMLTPDEQKYHDAILDEDMTLVGGGIGYQVSNKVMLTASARLFLFGQNTQNASVIAVGAAWSVL